MKLEAWVVAICLIVLVVVINLSLIVAYRSRSTHNQFESLSRAFRRARNPWKEEDDQIMELSRRVADLKASQTPSEDKNRPPENE